MAGLAAAGPGAIAAGLAAGLAAAGPGAIAAILAAAAGFFGSIAGPGAIAAILAAVAGFFGSMAGPGAAAAGFLAAGLAGTGAGAEAPAHHMRVMHMACIRTYGKYMYLAHTCMP